MAALPAIPPLSPDDHATLLAIISPDPTGPDSDPLAQAAFLARPDIQLYLPALHQLRTLRAEIEREHRFDQAADLLLEIARKTDNLVEKRRAAATLVRLLLGPTTRRAPSDTHAPARPIAQSPEAATHSQPPAPRPPAPRDRRPTPPPHRPEPASGPEPASTSKPISTPEPASTFARTPVPHTAPAAPIPRTTLAPPARTTRPLRARHNQPSRAESLALAAGAHPTHNTS
ncbi:MAG: hypothetical protein IPJ41_04385 [Phycisphaerales bacterium]|nr:hypothetical protein [Phycisphaerales bacterium]